ncbi:MAG: aminomethyl-transferring glycine dehydrogenase subunit GcvPA [Chloroflexota bacterium]
MKNIPNTDADRAEMLELIGVSSVDDLFRDIPAAVRNPKISVPAARSEVEIRRYMRKLAEENEDAGHYPLFLGAGAYHHFVPSVVPYLTGRGEFATPYTPYQPEVSQGTLQSIFEFQTLICRLTGMDVANASLYDGATAVAEAAAMAAAVTKRKKVVIAGALHPEYKQVLLTHAAGRNLTVVDASREHNPARANGTNDANAVARVVDDGTACLIVQNPNFFGCLEDLGALGQVAHEKGALFVVSAYPIALGLLQPPSAYGADVVVGEGQSLGNSLRFGGPYLGFLAVKANLVRYIPGRLVGATTDSRGQTGYVLTLQTREQHIRREKAASNVCTNEALCALAATIYLSVMGPSGFRRVAEACLQKAHYLAERVRQIPGFRLAFQTPFFNEFVVRCPMSPRELNRRLLAHRLIGGYELGRSYPELSDAVLLCVTEMNTREDIDKLVSILGTLAAEAAAGSGRGPRPEAEGGNG